MIDTGFKLECLTQGLNFTMIDPGFKLECLTQGLNLNVWHKV